MTQTQVREDAREGLLLRLRRIEGQARGVQRMVEEGRDCGEIVSQLASMRAAIYGAGLFLLKNYAKECASKQAQAGTSERPIEELIDLMLRVA
jgi:DNA-binding FrmR family transcriptional regulator